MPVENFHGNEIKLLNQYLLHTLVQLATKSLKHTTTEPQVALLVPKVVGIFARCLVSWVHYFYDTCSDLPSVQLLEILPNHL